MPVSMTDSMPRRHANAPLPQIQHKEFDERYKDLRRSRKVRFFVNGDRFFRGKKLYVTPGRYYDLNDLLGDLTGKLPQAVKLPYGVRQIFTPNGGRRVTDIFDLTDGESYVCAGFEGFKQIKYGKAELEPWSMDKVKRKTAINKNRAVFQRKKDTLSVADTASLVSASQGKETETVKVIKRSKIPGRPNHHELADTQQEPGYAARHRGYYGSNAFHPKRFYHGSIGQRKIPPPLGNPNVLKKPYFNKSEGTQNKPRVVVIVRNGPKPRSSVKILLNRRSVQSFEQLVSDISEAFGLKWRNNKVNKLYTLRGREVQSISDFFREDDVFIAVGTESFTEKNIHDIIEETYPDSPYSKSLIREWERHNKRRKINGGPPQAANKEYDDLKRDSGFAEGDESTKDPDSTYVTPRNRGAETHRSRQSKHETHREEEAVDIQTDKDKTVKDDKDKSKKRHQKTLESERRTVDEEKQRRGLVSLKPINDPFQKQKEKQEKERLEELQRVQEAEKKKKEEDERKREQEEKKKEEEMKKEQEEREKAVQAARDRQAAAEKAEREAAAKLKNENEENREKHEEEKKEKEKSKEQLVLPKINEKEKDKENEKPSRRKREKVKPIRKSKLERQVSTDEEVISKFDLGRTLGDGNFAIVRQAKLKSSNTEYALKIIDKPKLKGKEHMVENEIEIMKDCNHPNIVKLYEEYETGGKIYLLMEIVKGGDLFDAITQSVKFGEIDSAGMVKDLCNALFYLHSRSIVHRDLKPENLLVHRNKDGTITLKLADFGLAMEVNSNIYTVCGTPTYVAPEILSEIGYGLEVDMWAVGVITYILLCGFPPFRSPDRNQTELFEFIKSGVYEFLSPYWDNISVAAKDLIKHLLIVDRKKRYTAIDVLSHPWITLQGDLSRVHDISKIEEMRKATKLDLENQAKANLESYQKLKDSRR